MTVPYIDDTRESYVARMKDGHLRYAEVQHRFGNGASMWLQLFAWVQSEEIYGNHWDELKEKNT